MTRALLQQALDALEKSKRSHTYCDDGWYSCPQAPDGCFDDSRGPECDCGADEFNAELDKTITAIRDHLANTKDVEPVAWLCHGTASRAKGCKECEPLYLHPAPIPPGMVLVPEEPTEAMIKASWDLSSVGFVDGQQKLISVAYKAMLAAAKKGE
jgi:hypothetical protein